jgi:plastocyanin
MVAYSSITFVACTVLGLTTAAPSTIPTTGVVHRIFAGSKAENNGLHYDPENVVAQVGDMVVFHFLPKNHTVVQSSFDDPCQPIDDGKFSGFNYATNDTESENVYSFIVQDTKPFWYYCSQPVGEHCRSGMSGVINQDFNSNKTLAAYKEKAKAAVLQQPSLDPLESRGGYIVPNVPL